MRISDWSSDVCSSDLAIAAYQVGAESGLLTKPVLDLAVQFQGHHKEHADVLAKTVRDLGGQPVEPLAAYEFPTDKLKSEADVLRFAAGLESGRAAGRERVCRYV